MFRKQCQDSIDTIKDLEQNCLVNTNKQAFNNSEGSDVDGNDDFLFDDNTPNQSELKKQENNNKNVVSDVFEINCEELEGFFCKFCKRQFKSKYTRNRHEKIHLNNENLKCKLCGKVFSRATDVKRHMTRHTGAKPFICNICEASFTQSGTLAAHLRRHDEFKGLTRTHQKVQTEKPYLCSKCGKAFRDSTSLTVHFRLHTGEKPYGCKICSMR